MAFLFTDSVNATVTPNFGSGNFDAFGRQRVSEPQTLFSDKGLVNNPDFWSADINGAGALIDTTGSASSSVLQLTVGTTAGEYVYRQSKKRGLYQPGKSQLVMATFCMSPKTNVRQRVGYFDANDGVFVEHDGTQAYLVLRSTSSGVTTELARVPQTAWNTDPMDGTGDSGITMDWSKAQIFLADLEWLGVGSVRVAFVIDGAIIYVHQFNHANVIDSTYMGTANLPVRYEIENTGTAASSTVLKSICQAIHSEGGQENQGLPYSIDTGASAVNIPTGNFIPVVSVRVNPTYPSASLEVLIADMLNTSNSFIHFQIILNGALTGASWVNQGQVSQYDLSATAIAGGNVILTGFIANKSTPDLSAFNARLESGVDIFGVPETITLACKSIGSSSNIYSSMTWKEIY